MRATRAFCRWEQNSFSRSFYEVLVVYFTKGSRHILERLLLFLLGMAGVCLAVVLQSGAQQSTHAKPQFKSPNTEAQKIFASTCAGCHGLDGRGGERAPDIAQKREVQRLSDTDLMRIVREGVLGTGMPAFHSLASSEVKAVVSYLRSLQGTNPTVELPGSPVRGKAVFDGEAGCSACHMVAGSGGFGGAPVIGVDHKISRLNGATSAASGSDSDDRRGKGE